MLKKIKKQRNQKKQSRWNNFQSWQKDFKENFKSRFPSPNMEKPTEHLLDTDHGDKATQSAKYTRQILKFRLIGLAIVALGYMMYISLSYIYMVIAAFIISLALEWTIIFRQRITKNRWIWILITYLIASIFLLSGFVILVPFFFNRWTELLQSLMKRLLSIESSISQLWIPGFIDQISRLPWFVKEEIIQRLQNSNSDSLLLAVRDNIWSIMSTSSWYVKIIAWQAISIFGNIFSIITNIAIVLTLCVFFSIAHYDIKYILKFMLRHVHSGRSRIDRAYSGITTRLKNQIFLCIFIWLASYAGLRILELFGISIPQKWTLALLSGLFEIIPYLGPFLWGLPAAISALIFSGWRGFLAVWILYVIIQQSEEKFLVPVLMWKTLWVSPLLVFICMLLCGTIMWFFGILLAVPIAVIVSLAFHIPQEEELKNKSKKIWMKSTSPKKSTSTKKQ